MNYGPLNSTIADVNRDNALAAGNVFIRPKIIELYGSQLLEAAETVEANYEHLDEYGTVSHLPLTQPEIADILWKRIAIMCESYLVDIEDQVQRDEVLKTMISEAANKK